MKNYFKYLYKHIIKLLMVLVMCFLSSIVTIDIINRNISYYEASFSVDNIENFDDELLIDVTLLNEIKASGSNGKYENIDVEKMIKNKDFSYTIKENEITIKTKIKYYDNFFNSKSLSVGSRAKTFIKDLVSKIAQEKCEVTFKDQDNIICLKNHINKINISLIVLAASFLIEIIVTIFLFIKKKNIKENKYVYDNETIFSSPFHKKYWKLSIKPLIKVKDITTIAMLFALMMICKFIPIPSGFGNLGLGLTYLFFAMISLIYGPVYGFVIGIFSDVIGFLIDSNGAMFHLGYTLQAAMTGMVYGLCLYKTKLSFTKVFVCRAIINLLMNVVYGSFLYIVVFYGSQIEDFNRFKELYFSYALLISLPKNLVWLLPQSLLLYYVLKVSLPVLNKFKLLDDKILDK